MRVPCQASDSLALLNRWGVLVSALLACVNARLLISRFLSSRGETCNDFRGLRGTVLWFALHSLGKAPRGRGGPAARRLWTRAARRRRERLDIFPNTPRTSKSTKPPQSPLPHHNHPKSLNNLIYSQNKKCPVFQLSLDPSPLLDGPPPFRYSLPAEKIFSPRSAS